MDVLIVVWAVGDHISCNSNLLGYPRCWRTTEILSVPTHAVPNLECASVPSFLGALV